MKKNLLKSLLVVLVVFITTNSKAQWTFPNPTSAPECISCAPPGWTLVSGSPDVSSLTNWLFSLSHYSSAGALASVPEPSPGVTTFMTCNQSEAVQTTFTLADPQTLTVYFGGFGTNTAGMGPAGAMPGNTANLVVNGTSVSMDVPWDGAWHPVTYSLPAGVNTILFDATITDTGEKHAVSISIPADQPCEGIDIVASATEICLGETLTLEGVSLSGSLITWDSGIVDGVPFAPASAGSFTYTASSADVTECPSAITITVNDLPVVDAGLDIEVCDGLDATLTGTGAGVGGTYTWDGGVVDAVAFTPLATTTYTVTGTDANGCVNTDDVIVTVNALPPVDAGLDFAVCDGGMATLTGTGAGIGGTYTWDGGVVDGVAFTPLATTTYTVTGTDASGCVSTDDITVSISTTPIIDAGMDQTICEGIGVTLSGTGAGVGGTYTWDGGVTDGVTFTPVGTTTYTVTGTDVSGCSSTDDVTITVSPIPVIDAGADAAICVGETFTLTGSGAGVGGVYSWDFGVTDGISFTPGTTQTYTLTGTSVDGCIATDVVTVTVNDLPTVSFIGDPLIGCAPLNVTFESTGEGTTYSWNFGDGTSGSTGIVSHTYLVPGIFDVTLVATNADGCSSEVTYDNYVEIQNEPVASFSFSPEDIDVSDTRVIFDNTSLFANTYTWDFGDGSANSTIEDPIHTYPEVGGVSYTVTLTAENNVGCQNSVTRTVNIKEGVIYYIPNTFTPDGDNFNETFQPVFTAGFDVFDYHFTIYNRYGEVLFETFDAGFGWNGTYGDRDIVQEGIYIWAVEFGVLGTDEKKSDIGHVTLLR